MSTENTAENVETVAPNETRLNDDRTLNLEDQDCAIIFDSEDGMNIYMPSFSQGDKITKPMWMVMIIQELMQDSSMQDILSHRIINSDKVTSTPVEEEGTTAETTTTTTTETTDEVF